MLLGLVVGLVVVLSRKVAADLAGAAPPGHDSAYGRHPGQGHPKTRPGALCHRHSTWLHISLANRPEHRGGPGGILISLMSFALVLGYAHWFVNRSGADGKRMRVEPGIAVPALAFTLATIVSAWQATELWFSIAQIILQLQFLLMFLYVAMHVRSWGDVRLVTTTLAICVVLVSLIILLQFAFGLEFSAFGVSTYSVGSNVAGAPRRPGGTFAGPNLAATYLAS